jgi:hypothetical protein
MVIVRYSHMLVFTCEAKGRGREDDAGSVRQLWIKGVGRNGVRAEGGDPLVVRLRSVRSGGHL